MKRQRFQVGGQIDFSGMTGAYPRPGLTGIAPPQPAEIPPIDEGLRANLFAISQMQNPYGSVQPSGLVPGLVYSGYQQLIDQAGTQLSELDPVSDAEASTGSEANTGSNLGDRSELGQPGGLEEIVARYETSSQEPTGPTEAQPLGGYRTPSSLLQYLEHMRAKNTATLEPQEMQYGGMPMPVGMAAPGRMQAGPSKSLGRARQAGIMPGRQMMPQGAASPYGNPVRMAQAQAQAQAGPRPPGMGPGMPQGRAQQAQQAQQQMAQSGPYARQQQQPQQLQQQQQQRMRQRQMMMAQRQQPGGQQNRLRQQRQSAMAMRGPPQQMMQQRAQAMGQPQGGGGGMPGGPRVPPNLRGHLQQQRMQGRPGPGGNRIGGGDQRGVMARARQSQTGRPPISRRSAFPGRAR